MDWCSPCNVAFTILVCHGEKGTKPEGKLLINLLIYVPALTYGHVLLEVTERMRLRCKRPK